MKPTEFVSSLPWRRLRGEVLLEIAAVCLPILIYGVALMIGEFGLPSGWNNHGKIGAPDVSEAHGDFETLNHIWVIPDALFGGCVLFAFATIQGFKHAQAKTTPNPVDDAIARWRLVGIAGVIVNSLLAGIAVIFHVKWALVIGLFSIYIGGLAYKKIVFLRSYLATLEQNR